MWTCVDLGFIYLFFKMVNADTIFAISTPPGKSAISLIRITGIKAFSIIKTLSSNMPKKSREATLNNIKTNTGEIIDQTITTIYGAPKSFTGEDMVELAMHGGAAVTQRLFKEFKKIKNLRLADPGEFTRRAFENNKLDLTQVEAIADIVNAETEMQRKNAISHLSGHFFKLTKDVFENLKKILANIEAIIDFSDEDLPENLLSDILEQIENTISTINAALEDSSLGLSIRNGFSVVIIGKPNTGKSSFLNKISGRNVAIVTNTPGTTRDILESFVDVEGYPLRFFDTAGIRESKNKIEKIGIDIALTASREADINLVFLDKNDEVDIFKYLKNAFFIKSKQDLGNSIFEGGGIFNISSKTGYGIEKLLSLVIKKLNKKNHKENGYISRERHSDCLKKTIKHLNNAKKLKNIDLLAEDIRLATKELSKLFGNIDIEDILDIIFSDFCIGK